MQGDPHNIFSAQDLERVPPRLYTNCSDIEDAFETTLQRDLVRCEMGMPWFLGKNCDGMQSAGNLPKALDPTGLKVIGTGNPAQRHFCSNKYGASWSKENFIGQGGPAAFEHCVNSNVLKKVPGFIKFILRFMHSMLYCLLYTSPSPRD